ncbi:hypothetical protein B5M42_003345 [Paenibacillus athensensis]|uniref:YtpI-like protein n=1 Tax=Paenibacillus athensensis TaxID=1967502 RepID=A0A4Y8PZC2_9BACL|nr:hypothetical protein [Paenibacillus athensensis]MCD1257875.1 hypothetical protein [Paenibacillus athensensis]
MSNYIVALVLGILVLAGLTYMNLRRLKNSKADLRQLKKRTLLGTVVALALFVIQLLFRQGELGYLLFFGVMTLFMAAHYIGVLYYSKKRGF